MHIVDELIAERATRLMSRETLYNLIKPTLNRALLYDIAVKLADDVRSMTGRQAFEHVSNIVQPDITVSGLENLPPSGPCIVISNHPTGLADGIAVFETLNEKRPDHIYLANADALRVIPKCEDIIIPVESRTAFKKDRCVVIFPSGSLAKLTWRGLVDRPWESSAAMLAKKYDIPIIPLNIDARNSSLYYFFSLVNDELRDITLFRELLNKKGQKFRMTFGEIIQPKELPRNAEQATEIVRRIVESL